MGIDLRKHFRYLHWRPMPHSFGISCASDWSDKSEDDPVFGLYKRCGLWEMSEVQILYECAKQFADGSALDVGCHSGFTSAHIAAGGMDVVAIDPMLRLQGFQDRFEENMRPWWGRVAETSYLTSNAYFAKLPDSQKFDLVCIDGDHDRPCPMHDAQNAAAHLTERGVIALHDFTGQPVREAVQWLMTQGFRCRVYLTVHCVCIAWKGDFVPPEHTPDPRVIAQNLPARWPDFDLRACSLLTESAFHANTDIS